MKSHHKIQISILDRLVDNEPGLSSEPAQYRMASIGQVKDFVIRDIENVLNCRRKILSVPSAYTHVNESLFMYGLGDFTSENPKSSSVRRRLKQDIEKTISRFEPRLRNVAVSLDSPSDKERNIRFKISGLLVLETESEPITFDTFFDINRGEYKITR